MWPGFVDTGPTSGVKGWMPYNHRTELCGRVWLWQGTATVHDEGQNVPPTVAPQAGLVRHVL